MKKTLKFVIINIKNQYTIQKLFRAGLSVKVAFNLRDEEWISIGGEEEGNTKQNNIRIKMDNRQLAKLFLYITLPLTL